MTMLHCEPLTELLVTRTSVTLPAQGKNRGMSRTQHVLPYPTCSKMEWPLSWVVLSCTGLFRGTWKQAAPCRRQSPGLSAELCLDGALRQSRKSAAAAVPQCSGRTRNGSEKTNSSVVLNWEGKEKSNRWFAWHFARSKQKSWNLLKGLAEWTRDEKENDSRVSSPSTEVAKVGGGFGPCKLSPFSLMCRMSKR